jgi:glucarate dehydratase
MDDVVTDRKMPIVGGAIRMPDAPGLGVSLDRDRLEICAALYRKLGG